MDLKTAFLPPPSATTNPQRFSQRKPFWSCALAGLGLATLLFVTVSYSSVNVSWWSEKKVSGPDPPTQIHITQASVAGDSMIISWATKKTSTGMVHIVNTQTNKTWTVYSYPVASQYTFPYRPPRVSYESPFLHHVLVDRLIPGVVYEYICGDSIAGVSDKFTMKPMGNKLVPEDTPTRLILIGDLGQTKHSRKTVELANKLKHTEYSPVVLVGDLSYADSATVSKLQNCSQDRWDSWGEMMQPLLVSHPLMALPGNHEVEYDSTVVGQTPFLAYWSRYARHLSRSALYYSFEVPLAHVIMLNSYDGKEFVGPYDNSSAQYNWLASDLRAVNRTRTPWVIVCMHAPWYNSNSHHQNETQETLMRGAMEELLFVNGVDMVFAGHVHAYERSHPVYSQNVQPDGITYINIGDGGNREGHATPFEVMPPWSAFRDDKSYGLGRLNLFNATHAHWKWHRTQDDTGRYADEVWLVRRLEANQQGWRQGLIALDEQGRIPPVFDGRLIPH